MEKTAYKIQKECVAQSEAKAAALSDSVNIAALTSVNEAGYPRTCLMTKQMSKYDRLWNYLRESGKAKLLLRFNEIGEIAGVPIDHSFLRYKKELREYGYEIGAISMKTQTILFIRREDY